MFTNRNTELKLDANAEIMRLFGQLLIAFADAQALQASGIPMPGMPGSGADGFPMPGNGGMPDLSNAPPFIQEMLKQMMPDGPPPPPPPPGADGLYGHEDTEAGGAYVSTPEGGHPLMDEGTIVPRAFDPHDLDLEKYEDCSEKERQQKEDDRRQKFRDDPVLWMETAIYYAHQMVDENCEVEEAARCFLTLPGGPTRRMQKAINTEKAKMYDECWQKAQDLIQTAYDADRLDATDFQAVMVLLGDPCSWSTRPLKALKEAKP